MANNKTFDATIQTDERNRIFVAIPFDPKEVFGKQMRYHVTIVIKEHSFETSLGNRGGTYFFPFNKEMQQKTGLSAGDTATINMSLTAQEDIKDDIPADLKAALGRNKPASQFFETLSSFYRNTYIKWITSAKQEATRNKRIEETVSLLSEGKKQK